MLPRSNLQTRQSVQMRHQTSVWWVTSIVFNVSVRSDAKWHLVGRPIPSIPVSFSPLTLCHIVCICVCLHCGIVWLVVWHRPIIIFHSDHCHRVPSSPRLPLLDGWLCQRHVYTAAQSLKCPNNYRNYILHRHSLILVILTFHLAPPWVWHFWLWVKTLNNNTVHILWVLEVRDNTRSGSFGYVTFLVLVMWPTV